MDEKEIVPVEGRLTSERQSRIFMMRRSEKRIYDNLTNSMRDAWMEIESSFRYLTGGMGYGIHDINHVKGLPQEEQEYIVELVKKYREWAKECPDKWRGIVVDMTVFNFSIDEISWQRALDKKTVLSRFRQGLNVYCIAQGWGDQIDQTNL